MKDLEKFKELKPEQYSENSELIQGVISDLEKGLAYYMREAEALSQMQAVDNIEY